MEPQSHESAPGAATRLLGQQYARREPEKTLLYKVVRDNLETFLAEMRASDPEQRGLPRYVEEEFRRYLACGILGHGFVHLQCNRCGAETIVAFSCKTKTFCPSCLTRRMHAVAADLVGRVLPAAPYRHWVLSFPMELRFHLVRDEALFQKLREIFVRSVRAWLRAKARALGVKRAQTGAVVFTQRFSSRLMLFPHLHAVIPDGVFAEDGAGKIVFHKLRPKDEDLARIAARIARKAAKLIAQLDGEAIVPDSLDAVRAQAAQGELAIKIAPVERVEETAKRLVANVDGFSLQAARHLHENDRAGLEFLLRYVLRPPLSLERMRELPNGKILVGFKRPLASGTAAIELAPMTLMRRLASIVPPPGSHDTSYFGVFAAHSAWRKRLVRAVRKDPEDCRAHPGWEEHEEKVGTVPDVIDPMFGREDSLDGEEREGSYIPWAELLKHVYRIDVLECPCGGRREVKAHVKEPEKIREVLEHLGLWSEAPKAAKAREPPQPELFDRATESDGVDPPAPDFVA